MLAVRKNGMALQFIENKTPELCLEPVKQDGKALLYIKNLL